MGAVYLGLFLTDRDRLYFTFTSLYSPNPDPTDAKMTFWRQAGLNYIQYSQIAARVVRKSLKPEPKALADKRGDGGIKMKKWIGGKPEGYVSPQAKASG